MPTVLDVLWRKIQHRLPYRRLPHDDFIVRLRCSVIGEGMLHPGNIYLMDQAIQQMPSGGCVLEIGSYGGLSANLMTYLLQKHRREAPLFCCDAWVYEGFHDDKNGATPWMDGRSDVSRLAYMQHIKASFIQSARLLSSHQLPHAVHLDSDAFFKAWATAETVTDVFDRPVQLGSPISFAYIDGNHAYDFARRDVLHTAQFLLPGGLILLDDAAVYQTFGSAQLAKELRRHPDFELVMANPHPLFRKKLR
jgi:hypothetical protein